MCGIVGIISKRLVADRLIFGLKALEYRGYDSAGLVLSSKFIFKTTKSLSFLEQMINDKIAAELFAPITENAFENKSENTPETASENSQIFFSGLAHTRWATHGNVSTNNAHPIRVLDAFIVHNGIFENALQVKDDLAFSSSTQTDTEILLALFLALYEKLGTPLLALETTLQIAHGSYAFVIMLPGDRLFWAKKGVVPLILAQNDDSVFVCSDIEALSENCKIFEIADGSFGYLAPEEIAAFPNSLTSLRSYSFVSKISTFNSEKTFMETEIAQQPEIWLRLKNEPISLKNINLHTYDSVILSACGSAYIACLTAALWLEEVGISARAEIASEWNMRKSCEKNALLIVVSQSGETADTLLALRKGKSLGFKVLAILNRENSSMHREADECIFIDAGEEKSVASTKAFTAQLVRLFQLAKNSLEVDSEPKFDLVRNSEDQQNFFPQIKTSDFLDNISELTKHILSIDLSNLAQILSQAKRIIIIGKNLMYFVALEGALKMKEITYLNVEAYPAGELKHGYLALVDSDCFAITLIPDDQLFYNKIISNAQEVKARGGKLVLLSSKNCLDAEFFIQLPSVGYYSATFIYTVILQRLAFEIATKKGLSVDRPRNLAKSVTVE